MSISVSVYLSMSLLMSVYVCVCLQGVILCRGIRRLRLTLLYCSILCYSIMNSSCMHVFTYSTPTFWYKSHSVCLSLSVYLCYSLFLSTSSCLSVLSLSVSACLSLSPCLFVFLCLCLSVCLPLSPSLFLRLFRPPSLCLWYMSGSRPPAL